MTTKYKGSQSFALRNGWIQKALIEIQNHPGVNVFSKNDGVIYLGVGANMVASVKYWLETADIIKRNSRDIQLSEFGELISKYDCYLESPFVWEMIHFNIVNNKEQAPLFNFLFNCIGSHDSFTEASFENDYFQDCRSRKEAVNEKYVKDDFSVLIRSYVSSVLTLDPEENTNCPLTSLKLVEQPERGQYRKRSISLDIFDPRIIYFLLLQCAKRRATISFDEFANHLNGPCNLFNLNPNSLMSELILLSKMGYLNVSRTAGLNSILLLKKSYPLHTLFDEVLGNEHGN